MGATVESHRPRVGVIAAKRVRVASGMRLGRGPGERDPGARPCGYGRTVPKKVAEGFCMIVRETFKCTTLLIVVAIFLKGNEGRYQGTTVEFADVLVIVVMAVSKLKQEFKIQHLNDDEENERLQVMVLSESLSAEKSTTTDESLPSEKRKGVSKEMAAHALASKLPRTGSIESAATQLQWQALVHDQVTMPEAAITKDHSRPPVHKRLDRRQRPGVTLRKATTDEKSFPTTMTKECRHFRMRHHGNVHTKAPDEHVMTARPTPSRNPKALLLSPRAVIRAFIGAAIVNRDFRQPNPGRRGDVVAVKNAGGRTFDSPIRLRRAVAATSENLIKLCAWACLVNFTGAEAAGPTPLPPRRHILTKHWCTTESLAYAVAALLTTLAIIASVHWMCANVARIARIRNLAAALRAYLPPVFAEGANANANANHHIDNCLASISSTNTRAKEKEILPPLQVY